MSKLKVEDERTSNSSHFINNFLYINVIIQIFIRITSFPYFFYNDAFDNGRSNGIQTDYKCKYFTRFNNYIIFLIYFYIIIITFFFA